MHGLNVHSLRYSLNCMCDFLNQVYFINDGGCCFVASLIAFHLDRLGVKYKLIVFDNEEKDYVSIQYEVLNMSKMKGTKCSISGNNTCSHYSIYIDGAGAINSNSYYDRDLKSYKIPGVNSKHIRWIYKHGSWNSEYNTYNNKIVKGIINSFFMKYE